MKIAKVVGSNSHVDYTARIIDELDSAEAPAQDEYGFGEFVGIPVSGDVEIVGIIYNSTLMNPEYANFGPRLSPAADLTKFSPDFIDEQGCLVGILLLGLIRKDNEIFHGVPDRVIPAGSEVFKIDDEKVAAFHRVGGSGIGIHYYSSVMENAGTFAAPLMERIVGRLSPHCSESDLKRLELIKQNLVWQRTVGAMRL